MNKISKIGVGLFCAFTAISCGDMSEIHQEYLDWGERVYIGIADSLTVLPGNCRATVKWKLDADPKLKECIIKWSESDSTIVSVEKAGAQWMETTIENLPEESLVFTAYTRDIYGNTSLKTEKSQAIYGQNYIANLDARKISGIEAIDGENLIISWNSLDNCAGVNLSYISSKTGDWVEYFVAPDELQTTLHDAQLGTEFSYITLYRPTENCIDVFATTTPYVMSFPSGFVLDRSEWTATASSDATHKNDGGAAQVVLDNNFGTYWHSSWGPDVPLPHWILVDMKQVYTVTEISVYKRKDNTDCKTVELYTSEDGEEFTKVGTLEYQKTASPNGLTLALQDPVKAQYIKCVITESYRAPFVSISEIKVSGR